MTRGRSGPAKLGLAPAPGDDIMGQILGPDDTLTDLRSEDQADQVSPTKLARETALPAA